MDKDNKPNASVLATRDAYGRMTKGSVLNPQGLSKAQMKTRSELIALLTSEAAEIHRALITLVRAGDRQATIYAHQQLYGKPREQIDLTVSAENPLRGLTDEELLKLADLRLKTVEGEFSTDTPDPSKQGE